MTEEEWLKATQPADLIDCVRVTIKPVPRRKLRLYSCACCRRLPASVLEGPLGDAVECVEQFADGRASLDQLNRERERHGHGRNVGVWKNEWLRHLFAANVLLWDGVRALGRLSDDFRSRVQPGSTYWDELNTQGIPILERERPFLAVLLRDIFGNPFRPVTFNPAWRTDTAVAVARQMYDSREFGAMPILADALQDAGCEDEQVLTHCREPGPHVRGCWVCDAVLGFA
jgi:hypothetical protein